MSEILKSIIQPEIIEYKGFLKDIKGLILNNRNNALRAVNTELINLNWEIGKRIFEKQKNSNWGDGIIKQLSKDLEIEFGKSYSRTNLLYIRKFYLIYKDNEKVPSLMGQISWTHHRKILDKINIDDKDNLRRLFYIKMSISQKWSVRDLEGKIEQQLFEKWTLKQTNFKENLPKNLQSDASILLKDSFDFNFLNLEEPFKESKLEDLMIKSIENTLKNFGTYFTFAGRQVNVKIGKKDYYIDLLFFHRKLRCFVVVELKIGEFKAEHSGKMNMYLSALETQEMLEGENPPIGIILCKEKDRTLVEYALRDVNKPMGVASYITKEKLPENLEKLLPSQDEIIRELEILED